ncbi:MAG TPA: hypothetical protein P5121_31020 [Caldilineaceae bacterium]|nr:hypothetical protein [Caldilineaceae bacterium]
MRLKLLIPLLLLILAGAVACTAGELLTEPTPSSAAVAPTERSTESIAEATAAPITAVPPGSTDPDAVRTTLTTMLLHSLTVSVPVTSGVGIEGAVAFPLETTDGSVLWLAHTIGIHSFEPEQNHLMALYRPADDGWVEVARAEFATSDDPNAPGVSPDYLGEDGVSQVVIEPTQIWIQVEGGVGAHSGVYGLFRFDGSTLTQELDGFSASPGVGEIKDLNGDGINEVLLDSTDYYVFCYACGVREILYSIWYWDGTTMVPVTLQPLSAAATDAVRAFNEQLLALVDAGLWKDAQALLDEAMLFSYTEPAFQWNLLYVRVNAEARQAAAAEEGAYPLLSQVFYGDYAAAVATMQELGAAGLFTPETPLIVGTVAEGWQAEVADRLTSNASAALEAQPGLAAAYFVRGWGEYVRNFDATAAVSDLQQAAALAPDMALYQQSLALVTE